MSFAPSLVIRTATPADGEKLALLSRDTFCETFTAQNTPENMQDYLDTHFTPASLQKELNDPATVFFIAWLNGEPVGYTKLKVASPLHQPVKTPAMEMERLYVRKAQQGQKIGAALLQQGLNFSRNASFNTLWLGVWEHNLPAIRFYRQWGFETFGSHLFMLGHDAQTDLLMKKSLE